MNGNLPNKEKSASVEQTAADREGVGAKLEQRPSSEKLAESKCLHLISLLLRRSIYCYGAAQLQVAC